MERVRPAASATVATRVGNKNKCPRVGLNRTALLEMEVSTDASSSRYSPAEVEASILYTSTDTRCPDDVDCGFEADFGWAMGGFWVLT